MSFTIKPAQTIDSRLLIGIAGAAGSGKTVSALRMATGITAKTGGKIVIIDTENKRSLQYAGDFKFSHMDFQPPFSSLRYLEAIKLADNADDVIIIDSMSHEHEGEGGHLEQHEATLTKMAGDDYGRRQNMQFAAWAMPKADRRKLLLGVQRTKANVIMCFRAKEKLEMRKVVKNGKTVNEPTPIGWQPIGGDEFAYEMDIMMLFLPNSKGHPDWTAGCTRINDMKGDLTERLHKTKQISEDTGAAIYDFKSNNTQPKAEAKKLPPFKIILSNGSEKAFETIEQWRDFIIGILPKMKDEDVKGFSERNNALLFEYRKEHEDIVNEVLAAIPNCQPEY